MDISTLRRLIPACATPPDVDVFATQLDEVWADLDEGPYSEALYRLLPDYAKLSPSERLSDARYTAVQQVEDAEPWAGTNPYDPNPAWVRWSERRDALVERADREWCAEMAGLLRSIEGVLLVEDATTGRLFTQEAA